MDIVVVVITFGHKAADCRTKGKDQILRRKQDTNTKDDKGQVRRIHHGKIWKKNMMKKLAQKWIQSWMKNWIQNWMRKWMQQK